MAAKQASKSKAVTSETGEPRAPTTSVKVDGEAVRFGPPDWAFDEMQWPLDAKKAPIKPRSFRDVWLKVHVSPIVWTRSGDGVSKAQLDRANSRSLETAPTSLDVELEAHTLYLTTLRALRPGTTVFSVASNALVFWSALASPVQATEVALRALAIAKFGNDAIMLALRDHLRTHGVSAMDAIIRKALGGQDRALALVLDDAKAAERYRRAAKAEAIAPFMLAPLLGLFADPAITRTLLAAICEDTQFVPVPPVLRAIRRHGTELAAIVLSHVEKVMVDPGHRETEKVPWLCSRVTRRSAPRAWRAACSPPSRSARW